MLEKSGSYDEEVCCLMGFIDLSERRAKVSSYTFRAEFRLKSEPLEDPLSLSETATPTFLSQRYFSTKLATAL